ncbi:MAG: ATP-binding protein [Ligilactobacillus agilis]|uniref:ATP-binding protein n=1 Tax=Ligilactobacillus agilis TaxID=1601 RepID=UPI00242D02CF|nr:ATP-binding protein [Ligilactobacillus agilis]MCI5761448.1 ATP-binding protein [Ligilactobacillus agilis]
MSMMSLSSLASVKEVEEVCPKHGCKLFASINPNRPAICPECRKEKVTTKDKGLVNNFRLLIRRDIYFNKSYWGDSELALKTFNDFKGRADSPELEFRRKGYDLAKEFIEPGNKVLNIIMTGGSGRGKSLLAAAMLHFILEKSDKECLFININEYYEAVKEFKFNGGREPKLSLDNIISADVVVVDDLGTESVMNSDGREGGIMAQKMLYDIFNQRNHTIVTTNLTLEQLQEAYNPKVVDRIMKGINSQTSERILDFKDLKSKRAYSGLI